MNGPGLDTLSKLPALAYLDLYGTGVGDAGLALLVRSSSLIYLDVARTQVDEAAIAKLKTLKPELIVVHPYMRKRPRNQP